MNVLKGHVYLLFLNTPRLHTVELLGCGLWPRDDGRDDVLTTMHASKITSSGEELEVSKIFKGELWIVFSSTFPHQILLEKCPLHQDITIIVKAFLAVTEHSNVWVNPFTPEVSQKGQTIPQISFL